MALAEKIKCKGIKPTKTEVYTIAAELVESEQIKGFRKAIIEAFKSFDYYGDDYYGYGDNYYGYGYYYGYYYDYNYGYSELSIQEKVIALLFLAAKYS